MQECGECTLCCKLLGVEDLNKALFEDCPHRKECQGCSIYENRPKGCREFECAYLKMEKVGKELRPDQCGVVFEKITDNIFLGTMDKDTKIKPIVQGQINAFNKQGFAVVLAQLGGPKKIFPQKGKTEADIINEISKKYGSA